MTTPPSPNPGALAHEPTEPGAATTVSPQRLEMLMDVPLEVSVELGRSRLAIRELLSLGPGSVVELDKDPSEPLDILVNGRLVARGEAVVVNDQFGVRITDIVSPAERLARLR
ncbi:MAG: flagellar motor switch protein FliN [Myxococcota bacterium]